MLGLEPGEDGELVFELDPEIDAERFAIPE